MTEAILLGLCGCTALFFICREIKINDDRKSHNRWLSELRDCLHTFEYEFRLRCQEISKDNFSEYSRRLYCANCVTVFARNWQINAMFEITCKHTAAINELKKEYLNDIYKKIVAKKGERYLTNLPDYIIKEYERNISEIAETFINLDNLMSVQIRELRDNEDYGRRR